MARFLILLFALSLSTGCQLQAVDEGGRIDMAQDEQSIQRWFDDWIKATTEGDLELARRLIADDAVFLVPHAGQMDKESFAAAATASDPNTDFELDCSIQEVKIVGDYAWLLSRISLAMTDKSSGSKTLMKGDGLSVLKRQGNGWVVVRDANTMVVVEDDQ